MSLRFTRNTAGQAYALTVLTPIVRERLDALQTVLNALPKRPSPLARLTGTHFARFVIIDDFVTDRSQPQADSLRAPYLLFSATFDGALDPFLDALDSMLGEQAQAIWGHCLGAPDPARGAPLKAYLKHNQLDTGLFYCAYPDADVATVQATLRCRQRTIELAVRGQSMTPEQLRQAFLAEF